MSSYSRPVYSRTTTRIQWDDSDDDEFIAGGQRLRRPCLKKARPCECTSGSGDNRIADFVEKERSHHLSSQRNPSPCACEPRPSVSGCHCPSSWQQTILRTIKGLYCFWKRLCKDPFRWEMLKSGLLFSLGLRLFREMYCPSDELETMSKCIQTDS